MQGAGEELTFDAAERELIRKKLICYMKENRIGAGRLATRIAAAHPLKPEIPVSTLQRFLAGLMRTNEPAVALCYRFAESLTVSDPIAKLGERLSIFYGAGSEHDYSGTYESSTTDQSRIYSRVNIVADAGFWRVTENVTQPDDHAIYDGALVCSGHAAVVVLKDRLAGLARNVMLAPVADDLLRGLGITMHFAPFDVHNRPWNRSGKDFHTLDMWLRKK